MDGIELRTANSSRAIKEKREPNSSLRQVLPCMQVLGKLEQMIDPNANAWCSV
jgi:2-hydroxy-4-carboxymuconate semialdehyde hemiacetal dehydrogenase